MTESLITQHIDLWTSSIEAKSTAGRGSKNKFDLYGIKKLRELILELAVRGKLVPQDPSDEPASILLEKIAAEKAQLIENKQIKKSADFPMILNDELPCELPNGWEWASIGFLSVQITDGVHHTPTYVPAGIPFISVKDIDGEKISFSDCKYISVEQHTEINKRCNPELGDILICRIGTLGRATIVNTTQPFSLFVSVGLLKFIQNYISPKYIHKVLHSPLLKSQYDKIKVGGSHTNKLNLGDIPKLMVAVAPLAEQHRIIAKIDELMALCDQLEQQTRTSIDAHATLVDTLLETLTNSADAAELEQNWARISEHFDMLFTTEQSIDALKQTILQLAVMGKLVRQDPTDEPASVLLEKIAAEKAQLIKDKKIKKEKPLPPISDEEKPFELPQGWEWCRISHATFSTDYGLSEKTSKNVDGVPVLKMGDVQSGCILLGGQETVPNNTDGLPGLYLKKDDLLYNRTNSAELVGKTGIFNGDDDKFTFASYLIRIRTLKNGFFPTFFNMNMCSPLFRVYQINPLIKQQCGQANVNGTLMKNMLIAIAPENEQLRIIKKYNQLMDLCNKLTSIVQKSKKIQLLLTESIVDEELN
jgi:Restriction endonuclease S subunits